MLFLVNHLITEIMQILLEVVHSCSLAFQINASLLEQLVLSGLMTKDRLWYRSDIVFQISKLISDRFRERFLHC